MAIAWTRARARAPTAQAAHGGHRVRQALLACGVLSSPLYVATDILGGLRYDGYSFTALTISELGATGAPSKPFVDPLFMTYGILLVAFGLGVTWEAVGRHHAVRAIGGILAGIGLLGLVTGPFSAVHMRGAERSSADILHIAVISVTVLSIMLAVGLGTVALGGRFKTFSLVTLLTLIASGALIGGYGSRLAAGEPTPGLGVIERVNVYAYLLWVAVLAAALLRHASQADRGSPP